MRTVAFAICIAVTVLLPRPGAATNLWVFGDSNVDTGWFKVPPYSGDSNFDPYLSMSSTYGIGEATNNPGPLVFTPGGAMGVEWLSYLLRTSMPVTPANQGGTNYATSGAKNVNLNTATTGGFPLAIPTVQQITNFISGHPWTGTLAGDLVVVDSGANDISYAIGRDSGFTAAEQAAYIESQAMALANAVGLLQTQGVTRFIVIGQPESFGTSTEQLARQQYDLNLRAFLGAARVPYAWADANRVRNDIIADPATFGIVYTSNAPSEVACNNLVSDTIKTAWALVCSATSPAATPTLFAAETLFADDQHWSARAESALASYLFCLAVARWPELKPLPIPVAMGRGQPFACDSFSQFRPQNPVYYPGSPPVNALLPPQ